MSTTSATTGYGDATSDRIFPVTRIVAATLAPFLILAFLILYFMPENTGEHFAWAINPEMTPMIMGSGYVAGAYYFLRMAAGKQWHRLGVPLPAVSVFASIMAILTVIHWDLFNHDHLAFILWVILYAIAPPLVFGLWFWNRGTDPNMRQKSDPAVPALIRTALLVAGVVSLATAVWMFFLPDSAIDIWPWQLSPLTARIMSGWIALGGTAAVLLARDSRWSAWRIPFETTLIWAALVAIAIVRAESNFDWGSASSWLFVAIVGLWLASFAAVIIFMEMRKQRLESPAS
ncbi:hypothetical protein BH23CHL2_BH23CHL2_34400 [soil metagenome]